MNSFWFDSAFCRCVLLVFVNVISVGWVCMALSYRDYTYLAYVCMDAWVSMAGFVLYLLDTRVRIFCGFRRFYVKFCAL